MNERVDFFGKYADKMTAIHESFFDDVQLDPAIEKTAVERTLMQCNFSEYLEHHPEEPGYHFDLFDFRFGEHSGRILTAFNRYFFKTEEDCAPLIKALQRSWLSIAGCEFTFAGKAEGIDDLGFDTWDMMQTAHFLYPKKDLIDNKVNFQLCKMIYPYKTLEPLLRSWD